MAKSGSEFCYNIQQGILTDIRRASPWYSCRHYGGGECHHPECEPAKPVAEARAASADTKTLLAQIDFLRAEIAQLRKARAPLMIPKPARPPEQAGTIEDVTDRLYPPH